MAVDEKLNQRVRKVLGNRKTVSEKRMFSGTCFLLDGNMLCAASDKRMMFRVGREQEAKALARRGAYAMEMRGRHMHGFVWVDREHLEGPALKRWITLAENYVATLPKKAVKRGKAPVV